MEDLIMKLEIIYEGQIMELPIEINGMPGGVIGSEKVNNIHNSQGSTTTKVVRIVMSGRRATMNTWAIFRRVTRFRDKLIRPTRRRWTAR